jgi:ribosomal protein S18 acetylase RimI-like enzyme
MPRPNDTAITISRAAPKDAEIICDIRDRAWIKAYPNANLGITADMIKLNAKGKDNVFVPRRIAHMQKQFAADTGTGLTTFVAKVDGKVVGYTEPLIDEDRRHWISAIYITPELQGMGIGRKLMHHALEHLSHDDDIYLEVISYNQNAINFYEHFGFEKTNTVVPVEEGRPDYMTTLPQVEMVLRAR